MDPERRKVRLELVRVAIAIQRYQDAKMHLEELLKASPQDADLSFLMGQCHLGKREFESAAGSFRKVIDLKPDRTEAYVLLAAVLGTFQSHPREARQWIDKLVQRNPKSWQAYDSRAVYLMTNNASGEALSEALKSLELNPDGSRALILAARCYLITRDFDKSRQYAAHGVKLYPESVGMYLNMANIESAAKNNDKAIAIVRQGLAATGAESATPMGLGQSAHRCPSTPRGADDDCGVAGTSLPIEPTRGVGIPDRCWSTSMRAWRWPKGIGSLASQGFEKSRRNVITPEGHDLRKLVDMSVGLCYARLGSVDQEIDALRRALKTDPGLASARLGLAEALLSTGNIDEALREFHELGRQKKLNAAGLISLARIQIYKAVQQAGGGKPDWSADRERC